MGVKRGPEELCPKPLQNSDNVFEFLTGVLQQNRDKFVVVRYGIMGVIALD